MLVCHLILATVLTMLVFSELGSYLTSKNKSIFGLFLAVSALFSYVFIVKGM